MAAYRAYLLTSEGHIEARKDIDADNDEQALQIAKQHVDGCDVELWDRARMIARLSRKQ